MIAEVGKPVRHRLSRRRGRVAYTATPGVNSTLVDFGRGDCREFPDGELEELPANDRDVPALSSDDTHAHISSGEEWSQELYDLFAAHGVRCVLARGGINGMDLIDFGKVEEGDYDRIEQLFDGWLRAQGA